MPAYWICKCDICGEDGASYPTPFGLNSVYDRKTGSRTGEKEMVRYDSWAEQHGVRYQTCLCREHYLTMIGALERWLEECLMLSSSK